MGKKIFRRTGRMFNPVKIGRKVGKADIDPFVTRIQMPNGPQNVWTKHSCLNTELSSLIDVIAASSSSREIPGLDPSIDISVREVDKRLYVIAVNKSEQEVKTTQINIENCTHSKRVEALFEDREIIFREEKSNGITLTDTFKPYEVHIYKIQ